MSVVLRQGAPRRNPPVQVGSFPWRLVVESFKRPYPVTPAMIAFVSLIPLYPFIPQLILGRTPHVPELLWDRLAPLTPAWVFVYGSFYLFLIILPVLAVREAEHLRRTVYAYLAVWITAYVCFVAYPTVLPRPEVLGDGFAVWVLRFLYSADPPYNCLPSLHVAHSFVSALAVYRVHRGVGIAAVLCACLVGVSTVFCKQHYVLDVVGGVLLASIAYAIFLRGCPRERLPQLDRRLAPPLAAVTLGIVGIAVGCFWVAYRLA